MNLNLKAVYYCATNAHKWGKGLTIKDAKKNAGLTIPAHEKKVEFYVSAALFNNPDEDELKNLMDCITADSTFGDPTFYRDGRTKEDTEMIETYLVGWITIEKNF